MGRSATMHSAPSFLPPSAARSIHSTRFNTGLSTRRTHTSNRLVSNTLHHGRHHEMSPTPPLSAGLPPPNRVFDQFPKYPGPPPPKVSLFQRGRPRDAHLKGTHLRDMPRPRPAGPDLGSHRPSHGYGAQTETSVTFDGDRRSCRRVAWTSGLDLLVRPVASRVVEQQLREQAMHFCIPDPRK